jgi:protein-disulfide isomerase
MGYRLITSTMVGILIGFVGMAHGQSSGEDVPDLRPGVLRFVKRAAPWYPDSTFEVVRNDRQQTPSGSYRVIGIDRQCESEFLSGEFAVIVDEVTKVAWIGSLARLPFSEAGIEPSALGTFLVGFLPDALKSNLRMNTSVDWSNGPYRSGALIPFWLVIDTGYGEFRKEAAATSDGEYVVLGAAFPVDKDPVAYRREILASSDVVVWDAVGDGQAKVEIVEFSDFECPACKGRWPLVKQVVEAQSSDVKHGMVSFPLTTIHPWSFRSACASWCVAGQHAEMLVPFKELFYSIQADMEVSLVTPTALDFVAGNGLDEQVFKTCYLRQPSLSAVHNQMALGHRMGVIATPTFFVNGWKVQMPSEDWFPAMIDRLLAGEDLL